VTTRTWLNLIPRAFPLGLAAGLCCLAPALASAASQWTTSQVDNTASVGQYASLALDTNKKMHISYFDSAAKLKYATDKSGSWARTSVIASSVVAAGTAIAVDAATNNPQISYYYNAGSSNTRGIRDVAYTGSAWGTASNPNSAGFTPSTAMATTIFNQGGFSYLAYVRGSTLYYTKSSTAHDYTAWATPTQIDSTTNAGVGNSIVVNAAGKAYVVGYNSTSTDLLYYTNETGSWVKTTLASSASIVGKGCSLAIDASGNLHLSYLETTATPTYKIRYLKKLAGGAWQSAVDVADSGSLGGAPSIAVDSTGAAHISFYYSNATGSGKLRYATNLGGATWNSEDVDTSSADLGSYSGIALDSDQTVYIAYYDATNSALKVSTKKPLLATVPAAFSNVDRGYQSSPDTAITITNNLLTNQSIGTIVTGGANPTDFVIASDSCSNLQLLPQSSCTVQLHFAPPVNAPRSTARIATLAIPATTPYTLTAATSLSGTTSDKYLVTGSAGNGGSINPTMVAVAPGGNQIFTVTPSSGFSVGNVTANTGVSQFVPDTLTSPYTLSNISADENVLAAFVSPIRILDNTYFYGSLQSAYGAVNDGWTIQSQASIPAGDLLVDRDLSVNLSGGYDSTFASQPNLTAVQGNVTISNGTLAVDNLLLQ